MRSDPTPPRWGHRSRVAVVAGVGCIYLIAFRVSFASISAYVARLEVLPVGESWLAPIMVDLLALAATITALRRSATGERSRYAWGMVIAANLASVVLNIAHAPPTMAARLVGAGVPLVAMAALGLLELEFRSLRREHAKAMERHEARLEQERIMRQQAELARIEAQRPRETHVVHLAAAPPAGELEAAHSGSADGTDEPTWLRVQTAARRMKDQGGEPTPAKVAAELGVSVRTAQRHWRAS